MLIPGALIAGEALVFGDLIIVPCFLVRAFLPSKSIKGIEGGGAAQQ